ncbi:hypothetical protein CHU92_12955 [Flavobacterium cyanobacteriorum]|uniref:Uncharacterized protein n=1 Tax=Flavobacterium cyanobacteriorum TaxID=2022802 RepID=A0A255YVM3_9FLAO|nr:hypothetical protein [Flavobacterium cyanobacteriorum]OYQ33296.1 hypothetical protein CHU92_12955 [Flavobacterium cyanobacteriorum]
MKLTAEQVKQIEVLLAKDIFYKDIRLEMTDHIASYLEETLAEGDDFTTALKQYMNSHHKVKLLTAVREQEKIKDGYYRNYFLRQFVSPKGLLVIASATSTIYIGTLLGPWMYRVCVFLFTLMVIWFLTGFLGLKSQFILRLKEEVQVYYLLPVLLVSQGRRYFEEWPVLPYLEIIGFGLMFTACYFIYLTNKAYKTTKYA